MTQNDLNHLTANSTLYTVNAHPRGPDQPFLRYKVVENRKSTQLPQNDLKHLSKVSVYTENSPPRPKFHSVFLFDQPFLRYKVVENLKSTK